MRRLILLFLAASTLPAMAHDLWIERDGALHTLAYGHERSGHDGQRRLAYSPEMVRQARCYDAAGRELAAERGNVYPVTLKGDCALSWFLISSGYWSKTPYGTKNLPKHQASAVIDSWRSVESVKRLDRWSEVLARPLGAELELTPLADPLKLKRGNKLRLRAWIAGRPAAGVVVAYFGKPRGISDAEGYLNISLRQPGFQLIQASIERRIDDPDADREILTSSLQFELK